MCCKTASGGERVNENRISQEEKDYLAAYDIRQYDQPSAAADMAIFSIMQIQREEEEIDCGRRENYRKDPEKRLKILLVRRGSFPYRGYWALPGGFCRKDESVSGTARRELREETGVKDAYLNPFGIFSDPDRDPRGWIISHGFLALIDGEKYRVRGGSDAWEARWFTFDMEKQTVRRQVEEKHAEVQSLYKIRMTCEEKDVPELTAEVRERKKFENYHEHISFEIVRSEGLAFDHGKLILCAYLALQRETGETGRIVFDLMPERFTLAELQRAYEIIQGKPLLTANFRRKIADYVTETSEMSDRVGHRPARLFERNLHAFYRE